MHALRDVNLEIPAGDYVAVMGPSGSGKSTLLNVLGCLDRPSTGSYRLDDAEVTGLDEKNISKIRRYKIGFVFQAFHLVPRLTAAANIELPMVFAGIDRAERTRRVTKAIEEMGLGDRAVHKPDELSAGQRQRVAIARSIVMGPKILLADEPTGNLDTATGEEVLDLLEKMNKGGLTLIVVTHDPGIGNRATRKIVLRDGSIIEDRRKGVQ